jgi:hypothetical protein
VTRQRRFGPILLAAAVIALIGGCNGTATTPRPTAAPTPSAAPTLLPSPSPSLEPLPSGVAWLRDGVLEPGTYRFAGFDPNVEVTVGEDWEVGHFHPYLFDLFYRSTFPSIGFGRFAIVKHRDGTRVEATSARAVVDALLANDELEITDVGPASIAGRSGLTIDIRAIHPQTPLFSAPDGDFKFDPGLLARMHVLDVPGGALEVFIAAQPGKLDDAVATVKPILDSLRLVEP